MDSLNPGSGDARWHNDVLAVGMEEPESPPLRRSRLYIGMALAVIIAGLAYLAWHGGQSAPKRSLFPAQAPSPAVQSNPPSPAVQRQSPQQNLSSTQASTAPAEASGERPQNATEPTSAPKTPTVAKDSPAVSTNGNQELATALSFLNGQHRDSATAAQWLWKAVEKRNTAATVLLARLYLRGDGVQKNCDQGRVLLDAAADKGSKDAASLLRNLQAFGCQ
jgi:TPR repeat protein